MNSFLAHFASIAVMFHMTLGCGWHHGLGTAHLCHSQNVSSSCCETQHHAGESQVESQSDVQHDHAHQHPNHDSPGQDTELPTELSFDTDCPDHQHGPEHLACHDDGCNALTCAKFVFSTPDFFTAYMAGSESSALAQGLTFPGWAMDHNSNCEPFAQKVRSHLLFGVQLI